MEKLRFRYFDEFSCTGPECPDSCCKNWQIFVSKKEYFAYKKTKCSPRLSALFETAFQRMRVDNDTAYVKMKLKEDGSCPFLGEDRLCCIQKELGEQALSVTCDVFPRQVAMVGKDALVYSCTLTCCHVAELLMRHPEGLALEEKTMEKGDKPVHASKITLALDEKWQAFPYIWDIYNTQIDILQNRRFTLAERMLILGYFSKKADEYSRSEPEKLPSLANAMRDNDLCEKIARSLAAPQDKIQSASKTVDLFFKIMTSAQADGLAERNHYAHGLFRQVADSISLRSEKTGENRYNTFWSNERYEGLVEKFSQIFEEKSYFFENVLVNHIFQKDFTRKGIWNSYMAEAIYYNLMKLCIPAFLPENYSDKDIALATTYTEKMLVNYCFMEDNLIPDMDEKNSNSLPHAAFLIC